METDRLDNSSALTGGEEESSHQALSGGESENEMGDQAELICFDGIVNDDNSNEHGEGNNFDELNSYNENDETYADGNINTDFMDSENCTEMRPNNGSDFSDDEKLELKAQGKKGDIICARETIKCDKCGKDFIKASNFKRHYKLHDVEKPKCSFCGKVFARKSHLKYHLPIHTNVKDFKCDVCGREFSRSSTLKVHMRVHTGAKPYKCEVCDRRFAQSSVLRTHMTVHSGERRHECNTCGQRFTQRAALLDHVASHSIDHPFKCTVCGKNHAFKSYLERHMKIHHQKKQFLKIESEGLGLIPQTDSQSVPDPIETSQIARISTILTIAASEEKKKSEVENKPFKCSVCGKGYSRNFTLTMHMKAHTGVKEFKCDLCDKYFARKSVLKNHMIVHSRLRRYKCDFCEKEFAQQAGLKEHLVKHNNMSNFTCIICGRKCAFKSSYIKHMRSHQRDNSESDLDFKIKMDSLNLSEIKSETLQNTLSSKLKPSSCSIDSSNLFNKNNVSDSSSRMESITIKKENSISDGDGSLASLSIDDSNLSEITNQICSDNKDSSDLEESILEEVNNILIPLVCIKEEQDPDSLSTLDT